MIFWYLIQLLENLLRTACVCESYSVVNFMKSKWSCVFDKHLISELKGAISVKYTVNFKDSMKEKCKYLNFKTLIFESKWQYICCIDLVNKIVLKLFASFYFLMWLKKTKNYLCGSSLLWTGLSYVGNFLSP